MGWPFFCCYLSLYPPFPISLQVQLLTSSVGSLGQFYLLFQMQYKIFWQFSNAVFLSCNCSLESMEEFLKTVVPRLHLRPTKSDSLVMGSITGTSDFTLGFCILSETNLTNLNYCLNHFWNFSLQSFYMNIWKALLWAEAISVVLPL